MSYHKKDSLSEQMEKDNVGGNQYKGLTSKEMDAIRKANTNEKSPVFYMACGFAGLILAAFVFIAVIHALSGVFVLLFNPFFWIATIIIYLYVKYHHE